jgi:hypothetical protein
MLDHADTLDTVGQDLDEARAKIEATRDTEAMAERLEATDRAVRNMCRDGVRR